MGRRRERGGGGQAGERERGAKGCCGIVRVERMGGPRETGLMARAVGPARGEIGFQAQPTGLVSGGRRMRGVYY